MLGHASYKNQGGQGGGRGGGGGGFRSHKTFTFQDFDELFRQFEDENIHVFEGFNRGSPFGHQSSFVQFDRHFLNLDDLLDRGEHFGSSFGSHDTFFGQGHFNQHFNSHHKHHNNAHNNHHHHERTFQSGRSTSYSSSEKRNCETVTQRVGNMVTRYTTCS
ncbi:hypothetical protein Anas_03601 [Armadillidium nasatum]|uniref:DnaJ-like protein subfamily B member 9 n=1 Tax=Armadillidium nasatum TaxID=96803 RepID=A0A5N5STH5_9CRUS|nr:hypothetical protein Anas_03601 [Armadillidium nasatum]